MQLKCDITGLVPAKHLLKWMNRILERAAQRVSLNSRAVNSVVIASEDRYGEAIRAIDSRASHTNTEDSIGAGKTIPRVAGNMIVCDIVLQRFIFDAIGSAWSDIVAPFSPETWPPDVQCMFYTICHEFGHAQDHVLRRDASHVPFPNDLPFSIKAIGDYYVPIVLTEFAACRNAVLAVTPEIFESERKRVVDAITMCHVQTEEYANSGDRFTYRVKCYVLAQEVWFSMAEIAKLWGHTAKDGARASSVQEIEKAVLKSTKLGEVLSSLGDRYPQWENVDAHSQLTEIWNTSAIALGTRFIRNSDEPDDFEKLTI